MKKMLAFYRVVNALSLDVAGGAMICAAFFAELFHVRLLPQGIVALGLAVWIVYTADHLLDARAITNEASTFRHRFHQDHFKLLSILLLMACIVEFIVLFFLRKPLFFNGLWLGLGVVVYIIINRWLKYFKELAGALLYCGGVLLPALTLNQQVLQAIDYLLIVEFFLIAFTNLVLFSWLDYEHDIKDQHQSLVTLVSKEKVKWIICILFGVFFILSVLTLSTHIIGTITLFIMDLILLIIFLFFEYFKKDERFRYFGDAIFFLPVITFVL